MDDMSINGPGWTAVVILLVYVAVIGLFFSGRDLFSRLRADLQRPAGGWTVGILTMLGCLVSGPIVYILDWPTGIGYVLMFAFLAANMGWGMAGYYPRRM